MGNSKFVSLAKSANIDNECLEKLDVIVNRQDLPIQELISFIQKGSLAKAVKSWCFVSSVNDHKKFIEVSVNLSKVSHRINALSGVCKDEGAAVSTRGEDEEIMLEVKPHILDAYKEILENLKVVYRALNNARPALTNPNLRIMCNVLQYDNSIVLKMIDSFDLTLATLPKLLIPTKIELESGIIESSKRHLSIRYNFIKFWLVLCSTIPCITRKDILVNNYKINSQIWKYIHVDSDSTILEILDFIKEKILYEAGFKRSTKCKILSESFIFKLQQIFNRISRPSDDFGSKALEFIKLLTTSNKFGLMYNNDVLWDKETGGGVGVSVNSKSFKIHNKLLYTFLTTLKPWESQEQLQVAIDTLRSCTELVPPYMNWIVQTGGGYHDPSLSSWWIGRTNFLLQVLYLPIPEPVFKQYRHNYSKEKEKLSYSLIGENVTLAPLSRTSIIKCLNSEHPLIVQLGLQIIHAMLTKLEVILASDIVANGQEFAHIIFNNIPEPLAISQGFNNVEKLKSKNYDSSLMKLTLLMIFDKYEKLFTNKTTVTTPAKLVNDTIINIIEGGLESSSGIDLIMLDYCLTIQFQQHEVSELKWWNKSNKEPSLFTSLVKLSSSEKVNSSFSVKINSLLETLTRSHLVFNENLICSPVQALLSSLKSSETSDENIWDLIDEAISRSMKQPYRYLDISHKNYADLSLFFVVIVEQTFFFLKNRGGINKWNLCNWVFTFSRYLIVIGESEGAITSLFENHLFKDPDLKALIDKSGFQKLLNLNVSNNCEEESFFDIVVNNSNADLLQKWNTFHDRIPTSDLDFLGLVRRTRSMSSDTSWSNHSMLADLILKAGTYLLSGKIEEPKWAKFIFEEAFWGSVIVKNKESENFLNKVHTAMDMVVTIFEEARQIVDDSFVFSSSFNSYVFHQLKSDLGNEDDISVLSHFLWALTTEQLLEVIERYKDHDSVLMILSFDVLTSRNVIFSHELLYKLIVAKSDYGHVRMKKRIVGYYLGNNNLENSTEFIRTLLKECISNIENHYIIDILLETSKDHTRKVLTEFVNEFDSTKDDILCCSIGHYFLATLEVDDYPLGTYTEFYSQSAQAALRILSTQSENSISIQRIAISNIRVALSGNGIPSSDTDRLIEVTCNFDDVQWLKSTFTKEYVQFMTELVKQGISSKKSKEWIYKCLLYVTKKFAESETVSDKFLAFLDQFKSFSLELQKNNDSIWNYVPDTIINTQLDVLLSSEKWVANKTVVKYIVCLITTAIIGKLSSDRLLSVFLSNRAMSLNQSPDSSNSELRLESAIVIYCLFFVNPAANSNSGILQEILRVYLGSTRPEDLLLKAMMKAIESKLTVSWITWIESFEMREELHYNEQETRESCTLIEEQNRSLEVIISEQAINETVKSGASVPKLPEGMETYFERRELNKANAALKAVRSMRRENLSQAYERTVYDAEFLCLLVVQIEEFVRFESADNENSESSEKIIFNVKRLSESHFLEFLIVCLSSNNDVAQSSAVTILCGLLRYLNNEKHGKDRNILRVYISNILHTIKSESTQLNSLTLVLYSKMVSIILNPGHFLYKIAVQYVLSNPTIRENEIPLYRYLIQPKDLSNPGQGYYRSIAWLLQNVVDGLKTHDNLVVVRNTGFIEWALNLLNSPFVTPKVQFLVLKLIYNIQTVEEGCALLISRFGILSFLEQYSLKHQDSSFKEKDFWLKEQIQLNIDQLVVRFGIGSSSNKRIRSWACGQLPSYVKRLHKS